MSAYTWQELAAAVLMATGAWTWIMALALALLLGLGRLGVWIEKRRSAKVLAGWAAMEDERRERSAARREAEWDMYVEAEVSRIITASGGTVKVESGE